MPLYASIVGSNDHIIRSTKKILTNKFEMKDLGIVDWPGIKISRTFDGLILSPSHFVEKVLDKFFKGDNSIVKTLIDINIHLSKKKGKGINQLEYSGIIRRLVYVMNYIRPNIAYLVRKLSKLIDNPSINH